LKEWKKLNPATQQQFKEKLRECLENPEVPKDKLHGDLAGCYKIKLRPKRFSAAASVVVIVMVLALIGGISLNF
jgi:mRNA interferase RelE/StbE